MKRDLDNLSSNEFDILIIGGGIYGACIAREAALRGLSVALIDKCDFGHATSANSLKIIHGGFRYLQQADIKRMHESIRERMMMMKLAPHLIHPMPCIIPTYGYGIYSKASLFFALKMNDLIGFDRNALPDPQKFIPGGKIVSRKELNSLMPGFDFKGITGGAMWYDCQVYNSERLTLSFIKSAVDAGAVVANYVKAVNFILYNKGLIGLKANDQLSGNRFDILARYTINAAGPWIYEILNDSGEFAKRAKDELAVAMNIVINNQIIQKYALGIHSNREYREGKQNKLKKSSQILFMVPWRSFTIIGTKYRRYSGRVDNCKITEEEIQGFLDEINKATPAVSIKKDQISFFHFGLIPVNGEDKGTGPVRLMGHYKIVDHHKLDGIDGLISVVGVKLTTARGIAKKTIDLVFKKMGKDLTDITTDSFPIYGGNINNLDSFIDINTKKRPYGLSEDTLRQLIFNYGSEYGRVLKYIDTDDSLKKTLPDSYGVIKAQIVHAVREEMAQNLTDVIFRRTDLGSACKPSFECIRKSADIMAEELRWDKERVKREINTIEALYSPDKRSIFIEDQIK